MSAPPAACSKEPPAPPPPPSDPKAPPVVAPKDDCYFQVPLIDDVTGKATPRLLRFDRQGAKFVISPQNTAEDLTWLGGHGNVAQVTDALRISETVFRLLNTPPDEASTRILLTISQYVATGRIWLGKLEFNPEIRSTLGNELEMASYLLELFTYNPEQSVAKLVGAVSQFRGDNGLPKDAADRIKFIQDIHGLRATYIKFRKHFTDLELVKDDFSKWGKDEETRVAWLFAFCRMAVIQNSKKKSFKYDDVFVQVFKDFPQMKSRKGQKEDFCERLEIALKDIGAQVPESFRRDCLAAFQLAQMEAETAARQSLKRSILDEAGRAFIQNEIQDESRAANMDVSWLFSRGRLGEVTDILGRNLKVVIPKKTGESLRLDLDFAKLSSEWNALIGSNLSIQREYILSALGVMRRLFDENGRPRSVRIFYQGEFIDMAVSVGKTPPIDVADFIKGLKRKLSLSEQRSEKWLPRIEAGLCAVGIAGLAASEILMEDGGELQRGVGIGSAGAAGAGCAALAGHYLWPKVFTVRNRYAWEGTTALVGGILGAGIYYWLKKDSDPGDPTKFPVDEYGSRQAPPVGREFMIGTHFSF